MTTATVATPMAKAGLSTLAALADTLASETRLLQELGEGLHRQRQAVAADDLQTIEEMVYATHRILMTLAEARRRRRSLDEMMDTYRLNPTPEIEEAYERLRASALSLSVEVETSHQVLSQALHSSEEQIRGLYNAAEPQAFYHSALAAPAAPAPVEGSLFNRRA